jgi:hypothetical protein
MQIVELVDRYDEECVTASDKIGFIQDSKANKACTRKITVRFISFRNASELCWLHHTKTSEQRQY